MEKLIELIRNNSESIYQTILDYRRVLHREPELSFHEKNTSSFIANVLTGSDIKVINNISDYSIIGILEGAHTGKTVGLRAELDALPIQEDTDLAFRSRNKGIMHACGHDIHMASLLGTAIHLSKLKEFINGKVLFIFESGEEKLPGGAQSIIESIPFKQNLPDLMMGFHVLPELVAGTAGFCSGHYMASADELYITVKGKGGHAALPNTLIDPIVISSNLIIALQQVVSRKAPPMIPSVLTFGKIIGDGATNIVPDKVEIEGTFRTMDEKWRVEAHTIIEQIAESTAKGMGGDCKVTIKKGYPSLFNDPGLTSHAITLAEQYLGKQNVKSMPIRMTSDDFASFSQIIPSSFFRLGTGFPDQKPAQLHSRTFIANEEVLKFSPGLLAWLTINLLNRQE